MSVPEVTLTEKQRFWLEHVRACERTGQSMRRYADEQGLEVAAFYSWKAALRRKGALGNTAQAPQLFRKAHVVDGRSAGRCRLILPTGLTLEFDSAAEPAWVAELARALAP